MRQSRPPGDSYIDIVLHSTCRDSGLGTPAAVRRTGTAVLGSRESGVAGSRESGIIDDSSYPEAGKSTVPPSPVCTDSRPGVGKDPRQDRWIGTPRIHIY
eukprot:COSAG02_NODE_1016_length_15190_cov_128.667418_7_plen_100_part_00